MPPGDRRSADGPRFRLVPSSNVTADEMNTLMAEITLGIPAEKSKLAPLTEAQLRWRERIAPEIIEAVRQGKMIEIPGEFPDIGESNR